MTDIEWTLNTSGDKLCLEPKPEPMSTMHSIAANPASSSTHLLWQYAFPYSFCLLEDQPFHKRFFNPHLFFQGQLLRLKLSNFVSVKNLAPSRH